MTTISELSTESKNKLKLCPCDFMETDDINQARDEGNPFYFFTGITPLMYAAYSGDLELTKELIAKGVNLEIKDTLLDRTALMWACANGKDDIVDYLLINGADSFHCAEKTNGPFKHQTALSLSKKDSCCSLYGFWQRTSDIVGFSNYTRAHELVEQYQMNKKTG